MAGFFVLLVSFCPSRFFRGGLFCAHIPLPGWLDFSLLILH
ncbi:hypothetical protein EVA_21064 [gut metagenome]|uniref:Uncharacterized protein n=1 Tax=gut metagenome TaxID=749906 RepID=J9F8Q7_9ZZZZ